MKIGGMVENTGLIMYKISALEDLPGAAGEILKFFAEKNLNLEYITESGITDGKASMTLCVKELVGNQIDQYLEKQKDFKEKLNIHKTGKVCVLGVYGPHFREKPSIAARFCTLLGKADVNILGLSSSISSICGIIKSKELEKAKKAILKGFELP